uniref:Ig-like domain-containing protein n=1 Tax=Denticeps clupeoides TaxID=299321 RepID=A0A8C4FKY0_9TELE
MLGILCTLITALAYASSQKVLSQTPERSMKTGEEAVFDCNIGREDNNYVSWYKQVPGEAPQFVLRFHHSDSSPDIFGTGFSSSRFTSKLASSLNYQLIISNVEVGDSAVYYCGTWDDSASAAVSQ